MEDGKQITQIVTSDNPLAIHGIAEVGKEYCIICPHRELGQLKITWFELQDHTELDKGKGDGQPESMPRPMFIISKQIDVKAHKEALSCACINIQGTLIATASSRVSHH